MSTAFERVRLENVCRSFGSFHALRDFDLTIKRGEFVALLGPSGCGKSTALNCLAGLTTLTSGTISVDDRRIDQLPPEKRGFGMVFQNYALFPHLTVRKNVAFGLEMRKVPKAEIAPRVDRVLELVRLGSQAEKYPGQLSGGQQQRVAIARAIVVEPALVLFDEPLSNLDAKFRLEMRAEIRRLHQELGFTTLYVTHDQEEALSLADRLVLMRDGVIEQVGTPENVYSSPVNTYVANFMGFRNVIELDVDRIDGNVATLAESGLRLVGTLASPIAGSRAVVAIRPEDFEVCEPGVTENAATVEVIEYQGRHHEVIVRTAGGRRIVARAMRLYAPGDAVSLDSDRSRTLVFPTESSAPAYAMAGV